MLVDGLIPDIVVLAHAGKEALDFGLQVGHAWASQQNFEDKEVNAALDYARTFARVFIVGTVVVLPAYVIYLLLLLAGSGADSKRLEDFRSKIWNLTKGLAVVLGGYVGVNLMVTMAISISELGNVILFWDPTIFDGFDFSFDRILLSEVALEGETIMLEGAGRPVLCESGLELAALDAGWTYVPDVEGVNGVNGCVRS